jgi:hypothetical protein
MATSLQLADSRFLMVGEIRKAEALFEEEGVECRLAVMKNSVWM